MKVNYLCENLHPFARPPEALQKPGFFGKIVFVKSTLDITYRVTFLSFVFFLTKK